MEHLLMNVVAVKVTDLIQTAPLVKVSTCNEIATTHSEDYFAGY